ncbi:restriction endonuclease subunit S [Pediococcus acidilactici]|uniref:restriction endonuclease subunit S n=1 Tax=Pediococcus acidilactici TaxID=1254 RepID=UPI001869E0D6|nr:restriction endonuclease subunit S [Pediococcus acidilactici]QOP73395.1 restriction endonuclease subunit S [Pediococcus acidilactici]
MKLKNIGKITTGKTPSKNVESAFGNYIQFLTPRDFNGQRYSDTTERSLSVRGMEAVKNAIVKGPSISVTCIGSDMGKTIFNKKDIVSNQQINSISDIKSEINPMFLYYLLCTKRRYLHFIGSSQGSTMPILNKRDFGNLTFKFPTRSDQDEVVNKINILDSKIELNNQINDNLLEVSKSIFKKYFPDVNDGDEDIGSYIKNYDKDRKPLSKKERSQMPGKYRYIGATSVNDYINKYTFDGIYLLLGEDGTVQDDKGYPILQYIHGKFWPNNHAHVLQGYKVSTEWLYGRLQI